MNAYGFQREPISPMCEALFGQLLARLEAKYHTAKMPPVDARRPLKAGTWKAMVFELVKANGHCTNADISRVLGLSKSQASAVLFSLKADGYLQVSDKRKPGLRGSRNVYKIAEAA